MVTTSRTLEPEAAGPSFKSHSFDNPTDTRVIQNNMNPNDVTHDGNQYILSQAEVYHQQTSTAERNDDNNLALHQPSSLKPVLCNNRTVFRLSQFTPQTMLCIPN